MTMASTTEPVLRQRFAVTVSAGECSISVARATEVKGPAAKGVSNDAVASSVGRRTVCIKKVLKVAWIIEITSARTESVSNNA